MSAESYVQVPPNNTGLKSRTRQRTVSGNAVEEPYIIIQNLRVASNIGVATSFRITGNAATGHVLFTIENSGTASTTTVAVRRLTVQTDYTAVLTTVSPRVKLARTVDGITPTTGTLLTLEQFDTTQSKNAAVYCRCATASDGGNATPIGVTLKPFTWTQYASRMHTAVGQILGDDNTVAPYIIKDNPIYLTGGQGLAVMVVSSNAADNANTNHYIVNCAWEEFNF